MSAQENKDLIRRYLQAIDDQQTSDWDMLDDFIAEDFVAHNPPIPGVSLDREGMKQAAEIFRVATPGRHEIGMQVAEDDLDEWQLLLTTYRFPRIGSHPDTRSRRGFGFVSSGTARNLACRAGRVISAKVVWGHSLLKLSY